MLMHCTASSSPARFVASFSDAVFAQLTLVHRDERAVRGVAKRMIFPGMSLNAGAATEAKMRVKPHGIAASPTRPEVMYLESNQCFADGERGARALHEPHRKCCCDRDLQQLRQPFDQPAQPVVFPGDSRLRRRPTGLDRQPRIGDGGQLGKLCHLTEAQRLSCGKMTNSICGGHTGVLDRFAGAN